MPLTRLFWTIIGGSHEALREKSPTVKYCFSLKFWKILIAIVGDLIDYLKLSGKLGLKGESNNSSKIFIGGKMSKY
jgi:hypothetical protein